MTIGMVGAAHSAAAYAAAASGVSPLRQQPSFTTGPTAGGVAPASAATHGRHPSGSMATVAAAAAVVPQSPYLVGSPAPLSFDDGAMNGNGGGGGGYSAGGVGRPGTGFGAGGAGHGGMGVRGPAASTATGLGQDMGMGTRNAYGVAAGGGMGQAQQVRVCVGVGLCVCVFV